MLTPALEGSYYHGELVKIYMCASTCRFAICTNKKLFLSLKTVFMIFNTIVNILFSCAHMVNRVEKLGYAVPVFDFRLKGVTSMSADIHKYGLGMKVHA